MILLDVDSKDPGIGISSPPLQFLDSDVLDSMKSLLGESGKRKIIVTSRLQDCST